MKRRWLISGEFYLAAPVVIVVACASLWFSLSAVYENYNLGRAFNQLIRVVDVAREMRVVEGASPEQAVQTLLERLAELDIADVKTTSPNFLGKSGERGFKNPWGYDVGAFFYPSAKAFRLEMEVSPHACRHLLDIYAKNMAPFGIRRVDAREQDPNAAWRLVYEESQQKGVAPQLGAEAIASGCGRDEHILLSLTFLL
ncbi:MAG: hypothetical protein WC612_08735 [Bdellovibrionales bacterium]|jgi:hypothetical protein